MVSVVGLEPTGHKSTDSKSAMFANFITRTSKCWTSTSCATKIYCALRFFTYRFCMMLIHHKNTPYIANRTIYAR